MPAFDLRGILVAKYSLTPEKQAVYTGITSIGDAMDVNLDFRFAEGRLYAESTLAEYVRKCVGGTISIAVKYIPTDVQKMMYGTKEKERSITYTPAPTTDQPSPSETTKKVKSLVTGGRDRASYCGVTFYAPDMIDGNEKFTAVFIHRSLFGNPAMAFKTAGENIQFNTPTTTGEFLNDNTAEQNMLEAAILDTEEEAIAWTKAVLSSAAA